MLRATRPLAALSLVLVVAGCATAPHPADPLAIARADLKSADAKHSPALWLDAARQALPIAVSPAACACTRTEAVAIYNQAVAHAAVALASQASAPGYAVTITKPRGVDRFLVASDISCKHLGTRVTRAGFGGTLVGVTNAKASDPNCPPQGFTSPWTAVAEFGTSREGGATPVSIHFYDPDTVSTIRIEGARRPLAGDFSAPLAFYPHPNELVFGILAMMRSDLSIRRSALMFYEPYDPNKIPVIFVHGLMSSPHAWLEVVNQLETNPEFRRRYQVWGYFYPTGAPIAMNAMAFREALAELPKRYPIKRNIVVVGHSMGGILTRMQVTNTGRALWDGVFGSKAASIAKEVPPNSPLEQALVFRANPYISHVIFIAPPHRGSYLATLRISNLGGMLIRMPASLVKHFDHHAAGIMRQVEPSMRSIPTSIQGLSPKSRLLCALAKIPPAVPYDCIIGNRGRYQDPLFKSSDGIVPYWSSHLDGARSELIVPTGHDAFNNPASVADIERILGVAPAAKP